jgi:DNA-binding transcriptional ArsR family regulator
VRANLHGNASDRGNGSAPALSTILEPERFLEPNLPSVFGKYRLTDVKTAQVPGWTALGDPTRRAIFERIVDRPRPVAELALGLPVSRPAVSQHLKVLKNAQLVIDQRAGTQRVYRLDPRGLGALRADLERFWKKALTAYKSAVEDHLEDL